MEIAICEYGWSEFKMKKVLKKADVVLMDRSIPVLSEEGAKLAPRTLIFTRSENSERIQKILQERGYSGKIFSREDAEISLLKSTVFFDVEEDIDTLYDILRSL